MLHFLIIILSYITYFCYYLIKFFNLVSPKEGTGRINPPLTKNQERKVKNMEKETEEIPLRILGKIL
jgi:phosphotransferase system  glucose/maltose/N-acetylglucosamine-specific IIC component